MAVYSLCGKVFKSRPKASALFIAVPTKWCARRKGTPRRTNASAKSVASMPGSKEFRALLAFT